MDDFESLLEKEITESLTKHPELWTTSIMGIKRSDGLEVYIGTFSSLSTVEIYSPYKYVFKNEKTKIRLWRMTSDFKDAIYRKRDEEKEKDSKNKLSDFLNLDSRKNKLDRLDKLSEINSKSKKEATDTNEEKKEESFFTRLINKLII